MVEVVGLCVILFIVIYASCSRVYPPVTISARLLCNYKDNIKLTSKCAKGNEEPETAPGRLTGKLPLRVFLQDLNDFSSVFVQSVFSDTIYL